uniref:Uncharacterized protein n=1 Tax=Leersia perrieri TaxID=77586 RepID=A0A0D9V2Q8_9ORYZ
MRNPSQMLLQVAILASVLATPSLGRVMKCKCLMCVCDVDPHPVVTPSVPVHHYSPPHEEATPVYYLPPPAVPYAQYPYPQGQGAYGQYPYPYPQYIHSAAHGDGVSSRLVAVSALLVSGLLPLLVCSV